MAIPDRLEEDIGEAKGEDVLNRLLSEVVIDAVDLWLGEDGVDGRVELSRGFEIVAEWLLNHDPVPSLGWIAVDLLALGETYLTQQADDRLVEAGGRREIVEPVAIGAAL